jgi:hypothetical protein
MNRVLIVLGALLAGMATLATPAAAQSAPAPVDAGHYRAAYGLAQALRTEQSVLAETAHLFSDSGIAQMQQNAAIASLEHRYPGVTKFMFGAARPELERQVVAGLPDLWNRLAQLFAAEMTESEIAQATAYYLSPEGERFKAAMLKNYDFGGEISAAAKAPDAAIDPKDISKGVAAGVPGTLRDLSASDKAALEAFSRTPAFRKIVALNARVLEISAAWGSRADPEGQARVNKIMEAAVTDYMARKPAAAQ